MNTQIVALGAEKHARMQSEMSPHLWGEAGDVEAGSASRPHHAVLSSPDQDPPHGVAVSEALKARRVQIFERDNWRCLYCGVPVQAIFPNRQDSATLDHILASTQGGSDEATNLRTACKSCNSQKWNRTVEEFRQMLRLASNEQRTIGALQKVLAAASLPAEQAQKIKEVIEYLNETTPEITFFFERALS